MVDKNAFGPSNPTPSPQKTLEKITKLAVRAGRNTRARGAAKKTR